MTNVMNYVNAVRDYLDGDDWKYEYDANRNLIRTGLNLKCKLQSTNLFIAFSDEGFNVIATIGMKAGEANRTNVAEYITRANYGLRSGNFEMDYSDGEVRYKVFTYCGGLETISEEMIKHAIFIPASMFERYGDGLAAVMLGFSDPITEIANAEKK